MHAWVDATAAAIADRAQADLAALVAVSSPSGDVEGAEAAVAAAVAMLPAEARVERLPCSSEGHASDLLACVTGTGRRRVLLLGHVDTVVAHAEHRPLVAQDDRLTGSGSVDMKGGDVLALGLLRALALRSELFAEVALLLVCDEEWRTAPFAHTDRFAAFDACLCFEAGQVTPDGQDAVVVRRKAAGTLRVRATGLSAHSGASPDRGRNALLALAAVAQTVAAAHAPSGPDRLTAVPTILKSGDAFNVVPAAGELFCDLRSDRTAAFDELLASVPAEIDEVDLDAELIRLWPSMDARESSAPLLAAAGTLLGRPIIPADRGGASDASHFAGAIALTVDGLGPRGGGAHAPHEFVLTSSLRSRAEVAAAVVAAALGLAGSG